MERALAGVACAGGWIVATDGSQVRSPAQFIRRSTFTIAERASVANLNHIVVEAADLSEALCFDLCATGRAVTRAHRPLLSSLGLTYPQYLVMVALRQRAPRTVTELGDRLALDSGTLSPLLKRLDASGLVTRGRRQADERSVEVALTSKGAALLREAAGVPKRMASVMGLSADAANRLRTLLKQVTASLARHQPANPSEAPRVPRDRVQPSNSP